MISKLYVTLAVLGVIGGFGYMVTASVKNYGNTRFEAGEAACATAVAKAVAKAKSDFEKAQDDTRDDAAETHTVYVEVVKEIAVADAVTIAQNTALKGVVKDLEKRISDAPQTYYCTAQSISADSLSIHSDIDRLLQGN